jgi:hypothetical protein
MIAGKRHEWRKFSGTDFFGALAPRREWTTAGQIRQVRWLPWYLKELSLFGRGIGHRLQQCFRVWVAGACEQVRGRGSLKDLACVHHGHMIRHAGNYAEIVCN